MEEVKKVLSFHMSYTVVRILKMVDGILLTDVPPLWFTGLICVGFDVFVYVSSHRRVSTKIRTRMAAMLFVWLRVICAR